MTLPSERTSRETAPVNQVKFHNLVRAELKYLHQPKPWLNVIAIAYTLAAYGGGIVLLLVDNYWLNAVGTILLCHSLVYAAFLGHELLHGNLFKQRRLNKLTAVVIRWLTGMCYVPFHQAASGHIGHHLGLKQKKKEASAAFSALPKPVLVGVKVLEWLYFPIVTFLYLWWRNLAPILQQQSSAKKLRVLILMLGRGTQFTLFGLVSFKALILYFLAYILMITVARFEQAFEHTSSYNDDPRSEKNWTTFSPMISRKYPWLDILVLNFSYHNAHHILMSCPWYYLPALERQVFQEHQEHHLAWGELWGNYHRFRVTRLFSPSGQPVDEQGKINLDNFVGVQAAFPF